MTHRTPRRVLGLFAAALAAAAAAALLPAAPAAAASLPPGIPSASEARSQLAGLQVRPEGASEPYDRSLFPHWGAVDGNCNAREYVLRRDGENVETDNACRAVSGTWFSAFDGETTTDPSTFDIDHLVPLAEAWRSGADTWSSSKRWSFANNVEGPLLWAVTASSNRGKGDQDPSDWQPSRSAVHCDYAKSWINAKHRYGLAVDSDEKAALTGMLDGSC
ncbi:HNH endonuclease family protein [Nocardiopsis chromatogenes]|uniref:HNH endonuclease family protein n=1 Tax=Nocardiopsis chromatogenes TaxID=280239 RepID=UPI000347E16D|nr:HNH endonuclease family protein [Nocardiopsis chromatogenes]